MPSTSNNKSPLGTFRRYFEDRVPRIFKAFYGSRFIGALGILWDSVSQAQTDAWRAFLQRHPGDPAYDALQFVGKETSIPQLAQEPWLTYKERLQDPWDTWSTAGTEFSLNQQLTLSLFTDAQVIRYFGNDSESEFIVFFPQGSHPVIGPGPTVGSFVVGDGTIGPAGLDPEELQSLRELITHWKPAQWKCPWAVFELSGWTVGDGSTVGEAGLTIGGEQVRTRIQ